MLDDIERIVGFVVSARPHGVVVVRRAKLESSLPLLLTALLLDVAGGYGQRTARRSRGRERVLILVVIIIVDRVLVVVVILVVVGILVHVTVIVFGRIIVAIGACSASPMRLLLWLSEMLMVIRRR